VDVTVSVAAVLVAFPYALVTIQRYVEPLSERATDGLV